MRLLPDEQNALNDWILGLDQIQFATFLQQNGLLLPHITSPLFSMPIISGHFLLWLTQHPESVTVILTAVDFTAPPDHPRSRTARNVSANARQFPYALCGADRSRRDRG